MPEVRAIDLRIKWLESRSGLDVGVGADVVGAPNLFARREIERRDPAAHAHLAAARADDDFVLHDDAAPW